MFDADTSNPHSPGTTTPIDTSRLTLREITSETVIPVIGLSVAQSQKAFVAPHSVSLAQALFAPDAWYRAIDCSEELVGFVMLEEESLRSPPPEKPKVFLWRLMVDARFQGRGIGRAALLRVVEHVRGNRGQAIRTLDPRDFRRQRTNPLDTGRHKAIRA